MTDSDLGSFYRAWAWKREHLPDKDRFRRPYTYKLDKAQEQSNENISLKQAQFKASGFASTVWDSSIVVAKYLEKRAETVRGKRCLDLSAGCGLVAVVLARLAASEVVATDLEDNLHLLRDNCEANAKGRVTVVEHFWGKDVEKLLPEFDMIVACDVMYISEAVPALVATLVAACAPGGQVLLAHGRNKGGEQAFMQQVQGKFCVEQLPNEELHELYHCDDVAVYRLTKVGPDPAVKAVQQEGSQGEVVASQQLQASKKRRRDKNDAALTSEHRRQ